MRMRWCHPDPIAAVEQEIATILPPLPDYLVTTSEFDQVKALLERIENKRRTDDKQNQNNPVLRLVGGSNNDAPSKELPPPRN